MTQDHTVTAFDDALEALKSDIMRMGGQVEAQLSSAIEVMLRNDESLARKIITSDASVDQLEHHVQEKAVSILALRQPMANDLRQVVAAFKVASELERMGDHTVNIAKRLIPLGQLPPIPRFAMIVSMARLVLENIKETLNAFAAGDQEAAKRLWQRDEEVDELYNSLFRELLTYMMEDPRTITGCTHLLFVAKNIERMGDHATNIAESIVYVATGDRPDYDRPRADRSSFYHLADAESGRDDPAEHELKEEIVP